MDDALGFVPRETGVPSDLVLTVAQSRAVDRLALGRLGMTGLVLMENAGRSCADWLLAQPDLRRVVICCGPGNNGGDGFVIARHLANHGVDIALRCTVPLEQLSADARVNATILARLGVPIPIWNQPADWRTGAADLAAGDWLIDALLGTGSRPHLNEPILSAVQVMNGAGVPILAVDIPTGWHADSGQADAVCIRARATATFVARKPGFLRPEAQTWTGQVAVMEIGVPAAVIGWAVAET